MAEVLHIAKGERSRLPKKYRPINNLCAIIYDQLTEIFSSEHYKNLVRTGVSIEGTQAEQFEESGMHVLEWLAQNKLDKELTEILSKHITLSVVSDMVNFIYESMTCAKKGKYTVAYALLRKPFTDELLILEQILHDKDDFVNRFFHKGDITEYDPSNTTLDKRQIVRNALAALKSKWYFSEDLIYELRYDKSHPAGINGISNHALHIVTRDKNYKTASQNLNFVFSAKEDFEAYLKHYYFVVPYLLLYCVSVVDEIIFKFLPGEEFENLKAVKAFRRFVGYLLWTEQVKMQGKKENNNLIQTLKQILNFKCSNCGYVNELLRPDYELFFETELLICQKCYSSILISKESIKPIIDFMEALQ